MSEKVKSERRKQFIKALDGIREYHKKIKFIDNKIEFDQRFFEGNYVQFSQMISDIRKQIRINEEILTLQKTLKQIQSKRETRIS
jgi:hypothetical protein